MNTLRPRSVLFAILLAVIAGSARPDTMEAGGSDPVGIVKQTAGKLLKKLAAHREEYAANPDMLRQL